MLVCSRPLFFGVVFLVPRAGMFGVPRYDVLLIAALAIQVWMLWTKRETLDELKAIRLFHVLGFALEVFKTSSGIRSWSYPDFAYSKFSACRCFGFMYAAVGSYLIRAWRLFELRIRHHPPTRSLRSRLSSSIPISSLTISLAITAVHRRFVIGSLRTHHGGVRPLPRPRNATNRHLS